MSLRHQGAQLHCTVWGGPNPSLGRMVRPTDLLPSVRSGALSGGQRAAACWENRGEREQVGRASWRCGSQGWSADVFQVSVGPFAVVRGPWLQCADHHTARPHHQCWPWAKSSRPTPPPLRGSLQPVLQMKERALAPQGSPPLKWWPWAWPESLELHGSSTSTSLTVHVCLGNPATERGPCHQRTHMKDV